MRPTGSQSRLAFAMRALWTELFSFRFDYPIVLVPEAGPRESLHYYIYSDRLFFDAMELDERGIPIQHSRTLGSFYNPAYVAWYGLMSLERGLQDAGEEARRRGDAAALRQAEWLVENARRHANGDVDWTYPVDVRESGSELKAPWVSVMSQGLALSLLIRARRLGWGGEEVLPLCRAALGIYRAEVAEGGVRTCQEGYTLYEEYPAYPLPRVLDGFLFGLLGLYDLWIEADDAEARALFLDGVAGLVGTIEDWNYRDRWSWYGARRYLSPPHYHTLNRRLVAALARITGEPQLHRYAQQWDPGRLGSQERVRVYSTFIWQKNHSRLKAWRGQ